jgi:hypothetical protein
MKRAVLGLALVAAVFSVTAVPVQAARTITLHPSGFGEHSYAAWKADQGLPDSTGSKDQALYLQKQTATDAFAAGIAVFEGVRGMSTQALLPLGFEVHTDGWCGAGAPRFNVRYQATPGGPTQTAFVGCQSMAPSGGGTHEGRTFQNRTFAGPLPTGTVVSLSIVFDEGTTFMGMPLGPGRTWLDNIQVGTSIWTSASDNGGGNTPVTAAEAESILGEPFRIALGD